VTPTHPTSTELIRRALEEHAHTHGNRIAVVDTHAVLTFGKLWQLARARAAELHARPGTIVAVAAESTAAFVVEVAALWLCGAVPMPLDPKTPLQLRTAMHRRVSTGTHTCQPWKAVLSVVGGTYRPLVTGGEPPTVARKALAVGLGPGGDDADRRAAREMALFASPMHLNGPFEFAVRHLLRGGTIAMLHRFDPHRWVQTATRLQPAWVFLAPIHISRLLDNVPSQQLRAALSSVQTLVHSAAPCPPAVRAGLLDLVAPHAVGEYYGAAEYDGTFARADEDAPGALPISGAQLRVVDAAGRPAAAGTAGVIEGRSVAGLTAHYAGEPCAPAQAWRTVGDHGTLDHSGRLTVTSVNTAGRAIVGGVNVALARVHAVVVAHPAVLSCQVVPICDDAYGQVLTVRVTTDRPLPVEDLNAYCETHLRPAERPRHLHITTPEQPTAEDADHAIAT
jgi:acyl-CoA synthetase (AMP-forming)/AMP-acid ligase II